RLRLLDPNRYSNYEDFINETSDHKTIANIVEKLHLGKDLHSKDIKTFESIFPKERIQAVLKGDDIAKDNLIEDLLDQHGPGRVLFRNTRSAMTDFPKRKAHLIPLKAKKDPSLWLQRLTIEFVHDMNLEDTSEEQEFWFKEDPRIQWLLATLKKIYPEKA